MKVTGKVFGEEGMPATPRTLGAVTVQGERFIQTALGEWTYAVPYPTSAYCAAELRQLAGRFQLQ